MERVTLYVYESPWGTVRSLEDPDQLYQEEVTFVRLDEVVAMVEEAAEELRARADANFDSPVLGRLVEKCDFAADKIYALASQLKGQA